MWSQHFATALVASTKRFPTMAVLLQNHRLQNYASFTLKNKNINVNSNPGININSKQFAQIVWHHNWYCSHVLDISYFKFQFNSQLVRFWQGGRSWEAFSWFAFDRLCIESPNLYVFHSSECAWFNISEKRKFWRGTFCRGSFDRRSIQNCSIFSHMIKIPGTHWGIWRDSQQKTCQHFIEQGVGDCGKRWRFPSSLVVYQVLGIFILIFVL